MMRVLMFFCLLCSVASAQEFTTSRAQKAQQEFNSEIEKAKKKYLVGLNEALKITVDEQDKERIRIEKARIESDLSGGPLEETRRRVGGSVWTYFRPPSEPVKLAFQKDGTLAVIVTEDRPNLGRWEAIEPNVIVGKLNGRIFLYRFDSNFKKFDVLVFDEVKTAWKGGVRLK